MERSDYTDANRIAWDEAAPRHKAQRFEELLENFKNPGYNYFDTIATTLLQRIGLEDKDVVHLLCNNGRELLSAKNMGASRCVGFYISEKFLEQAHALNKAARQECEFMQKNFWHNR